MKKEQKIYKEKAREYNEVLEEMRREMHRRGLEYKEEHIEQILDLEDELRINEKNKELKEAEEELLEKAKTKLNLNEQELKDAKDFHREEILEIAAKL